MPTYEYRCQYCHELVEAVQRMSDPSLTHCPHCGKEGLTRVVSGGAGVLYKGEGWYVTDYSKKSSGGKEKSESEKSDTTKSKPATTENKPPGNNPGVAAPSSDTPKETKSAPPVKPEKS